MSTTSYAGKLSTHLRALVRDAVVFPLAVSVLLLMPLSGALAADAVPVAGAKAALAQAEKAADELADSLRRAKKELQKTRKRFTRADKAVAKSQSKLEDVKANLARAKETKDKVALGKELKEVTLRLQRETLERSTVQADLKRADDRAHVLSAQATVARARVPRLETALAAAEEAEAQAKADARAVGKRAEDERKRQEAEARKKADEEKARQAEQKKLAKKKARDEAKRLAAEKKAAEDAAEQRRREMAKKQADEAKRLAAEKKAAEDAAEQRRREMAKKQADEAKRLAAEKKAAKKAEKRSRRELAKKQADEVRKAKDAAERREAEAKAAAKKAEEERKKQEALARKKIEQEKERLAEQQRLAAKKARAEAKRIAKEKKAAEAAEEQRQRELAEQKEAEARKAGAAVKRREAEARAKAAAAEAERKRLTKIKEAEEKRQARLRKEREKQILEAFEHAREAAGEAESVLADAKQKATRRDQQVQRARQASDEARKLVIQRSGELAAIKEEGWTKRKAAWRLGAARSSAQKAAAKLQELTAEAGAAKQAIFVQQKAVASAKAALAQAEGTAAPIVAQRKAAKQAEEEQKLAEARQKEQVRLAQIAAKKAEEEREAREREGKRLAKLAAEKAEAERKRLEKEKKAAVKQAARATREAQEAEEKRLRATKEAAAKAAEKTARAAREAQKAEEESLRAAKEAAAKAAEKTARAAREAQEAEEKRLRAAKEAAAKTAKQVARATREAQEAEEERLRAAKEAEEKKIEEERKRQRAAQKEVDRKKAEVEKKRKAEERTARRKAREEGERLAAEKRKQEEAARIAALPPPLEPKYHKREESVTGPVPWTTKQVHELPALPGDQRIQAPPAKKADIADTPKKLSFDLPMISGDKEIVAKLDAWKEWADYVTFNPVTADEINEFHGKLVRALQEEGYAFAEVKFPTRIWAYGIFLAKVDCGPLGTITVKGNRYYSAKQIIRALARQDGDRFNHARIYGDIFDFDAKPDVRILATRLKPEIINGRRVINAELEMVDDLPIHAAVELSSTGSKGTSKWRIKSTLQHVNVTKHDDFLTLNWVTSPHIDVVNTFAGGYYLPIGDKYSLSLYGGYSNSDIDDVAPQLDVRGSGHYFGGQVTKVIKDTRKAQLQLAGGWVFQHTETKHFVSGEDSEIGPKYELSTPRITLEYASKTFDRLGGRNYFTNTVLANFADKFGSSEASEYAPTNEGYATPGVDGDFLIDRFTFARYQRFFRGKETPGKWSLFLKLDGQLASDALVSAMRKSVGGAHSVRGYKENELSGDQALVGTLELRTPLFHNFIPGLKKSDEYLQANPEAWQRHRLQFVAFTDMAIIDMKEPLPGEQDGDDMMSAGLGLRLGLTKFSQMSLDYGIPFHRTTENTPRGGRAHLSLQLQF